MRSHDTASHDTTTPPSPRAWQRGCRCHACHVAEGHRRHTQALNHASPVQVHGRPYTITERLAIGTAMAAPGGLAVAADIRAWLSAQTELAVAAQTHAYHEQLATEMARLGGD
jgi:hypothetical protein